MPNFRKLDVWIDAHAVVLDVYRFTAAFPRAEQFGLTSQMRRAAISIPANLAEGCGRGSQAEMARFASNALGSANELDYFFLLAHDLSYLSDNSFAPRVQDLAKGITRLRQRAQENAARHKTR
jgi:four helix bundle protein